MQLQRLFKSFSCAVNILLLNSGNLIARSDKSVLKLNAKFSASGIPEIHRNKIIIVLATRGCRGPQVGKSDHPEFL